MIFDVIIAIAAPITICIVAARRATPRRTTASATSVKAFAGAIDASVGTLVAAIAACSTAARIVAGAQGSRIVAAAIVVVAASRGAAAPHTRGSHAGAGGERAPSTGQRRLSARSRAKGHDVHY